MPLDEYLWRAHYQDGTTLDELAPDGELLPFAAVDRSRLRALEIVRPEDGRSFVVPLSKGMHPAFFRRRTIALDPETGATTPRQTITCIGWQKTERGRNVQTFLFLFSDGSAVLTDDREAV